MSASCVLPVPLAEIYTFASKERDEESGLSYFGARYYSSDLSIWLSVDPMSDKYPSLSPYVYCANNPVKLVDPNGEEWENELSKKTALTIIYSNSNKIELSSYMEDPPKKDKGLVQKVENFLNNLDHKTIGNADNYKLEGHSDGANSASDVQFLAPYLEGAVTMLPGVSQTNDIKTIKGEDMFGNETSRSDKNVAIVSLATGGISKIAVKAISNVSKWIHRATTLYTVGKTIDNEKKK